MANTPPAKSVYVVSDGTGDTAETVVQAGLRQFQTHMITVRTFPQVHTRAQLENLFRHSAKTGALLVTTLVRSDMRAAAARYAHEYQVLHVPLLGPMLTQLELFLDVTAAGTPGLLHTADESYFKRIEAVEYTVRADDGKDPRMLRDADVVLVGVSRTSKTPLSTFLAHKGLKVSNQPIVLDHPMPPMLFEVDPRRVFALTIDPDVLQQIRTSRVKAMRMGSAKTNYCDMSYILAEFEFADRLFRGNRWSVLDVTNRAIEETAASILRILNEHGLTGQAGEAGQL